MCSHLDPPKAMGSSVLVFAETSNAIHGDRSKPLSQRPVMKAGDWAEFGRPASGRACLSQEARRSSCLVCNKRRQIERGPQRA
jgi:hypothetical protein